MSDSRLFFAAMPPPETVAAICAVTNPTRTDIALLRGVGERLRARACTQGYNRNGSSAAPSGRIHPLVTRIDLFQALQD